jgi:hypothetical protein
MILLSPKEDFTHQKKLSHEQEEMLLTRYYVENMRMVKKIAGIQPCRFSIYGHVLIATPTSLFSHIYLLLLLLINAV